MLGSEAIQVVAHLAWGEQACVANQGNVCYLLLLHPPPSLKITVHVVHGLQVHSCLTRDSSVLGRLGIVDRSHLGYLDKLLGFEWVLLARGNELGRAPNLKMMMDEDGGVAGQEECCSQVSRAHLWSATYN